MTRISSGVGGGGIASAGSDRRDGEEGEGGSEDDGSRSHAPTLQVAQLSVKAICVTTTDD